MSSRREASAHNLFHDSPLLAAVLSDFFCSISGMRMTAFTSLAEEFYQLRYRKRSTSLKVIVEVGVDFELLWEKSFRQF